MHLPVVQHTLYIFERLYDDLPPLVPETVQKDMMSALTQMRHNYSLTLEELEDTVIAFGKKIWPYRKAFDEFFDLFEGELGESFLLGQLSKEFKRRYEEFLVYGGSFRDLHSGGQANFFSPEERGALCVTLVDVGKLIRAHTVQAVLSTEQRRYEERIVEFTGILNDIEKRLGTLRQMAEDEQEHPELAAEIRGQVREFEYGLCLLGAGHSYEAVCSAEEHFIGRKKEKRARTHSARST